MVILYTLLLLLLLFLSFSLHSLSVVKGEKATCKNETASQSETSSYGFRRNNHKRKWPLYFYETICNFSTLCLTLVLLTHSFFSTFPHLKLFFVLSPLFIHRSLDVVCFFLVMFLFTPMYSFTLSLSLSCSLLTLHQSYTQANTLIQFHVR